MSTTNTTPSTDTNEYQSEYDDDFTVDGRPVEVVDADSLEDPADLDAPEVGRVVPVPQPSEPAPAPEEVNPVEEFARETLPVNLADQSRSLFTKEEAEKLVGEIQEDLLNVMGLQKKLGEEIARAYNGRIWLALGYPKGAAGWKALCKDKFVARALLLSAQERNQIILGISDNSQISDRQLAAALGISNTAVSKVRKAADPGSAPRPIRGSDGKMYTSKTLPARDIPARNKEILERAERGAREVDLAEEFGLSQSRINEIKKDERNRKVSEGLTPVIRPDDSVVSEMRSDEPLFNGDDGVDQAVEMYVDGAVAKFEDARAYLEDLNVTLDDPQWQPGSPTVDRIVTKAYPDILHLLEGMSRFLSRMSAGSDDPDKRDSYPGDNFAEFLGGGDKARDGLRALDELQRVLDRICDE